MNEQAESDMLENTAPEVAVVSEPTPQGPSPLMVMQGADVLPVKDGPVADPPKHSDPAKAAAIANFLFHFKRRIEKQREAGNTSIPDCFFGFTMAGNPVPSPRVHAEVAEQIFKYFEEQGLTVERETNTIHI